MSENSQNQTIIMLILSMKHVDVVQWEKSVGGKLKNIQYIENLLFLMADDI